MVLELTQRPGEAHPITDPGIPTLPAVLDPIALGAHLSALRPAPPPGSQDVHVRLLRHHAGNRCVVEVTWRRGRESLSLIGKVYARDRSDVYRVMEEIRRAGLGPDAEFSIPQPTAYLEALQLLLQEKVQGRPATESFLSNDESERATAAERCASWLVEFHAVAPRIGPRFDLRKHLLSLELWARHLAGLGEPFAEQAGELFRRLEGAASALPGADLCTIHGDYTHHQVILRPGRTVTVDWDKHRLGDPSHDVARFAVGLQRLAQRRLGSMRALDGPAETFLKTYVASARSDLAAPLAFHRAAICLEHAKHDVHKQADGWPERAAAALDEGLRVLAQGV
jgi:aminoglycoside phosphotransferase (APT) family kinase protein